MKQIQQINENKILQEISTIQNLQQSKKAMTDLIKIKGIAGKQNKKKWNKNIDISGLLTNIEKQNNQSIRDKWTSSLVVEADTDNIRKPLDPNRFKSKGVPLPKQKFDNKIRKKNLLAEPLEDVWGENTTQVKSKYKMSSIPSVVKPKTGHSYNPDQASIKQVLENVIDYQGPKQKKTKKIKKTQFRVQQVRHRNKNVRRQQLQLRERRITKQLQHQLNTTKLISRQLKQKFTQIKQKVTLKQLKQNQLQKESKTGRVRYGKKIGKTQYKFKQELPQIDEIGKKLSHVGGVESLIKDRFDSVYRRGIFQPRVIKVHANRTKHIKSKERFREDWAEQAKK